MDEQQVPEKPVAPHSAGDQLRAAREAAGMSRSDVAAKTRVAERHLEAIEGNRFADLAAPTYAVGFSRAYARAVGLDENDIAKRVRRQLDAHHPVRPAPMPSFEPGDPARVPPSRIAWIAGLLVVVVVGVLLAGWSSFLSPEGHLPDLLPDSTPVAQAPATATPATQEPTPSAPAGPVVLTAMAPKVWIKVTDAAGNQLFQKELAQGESYTVPPDAQEPQLRTGRADVLGVMVGGRPVPPLSDKPGLVTGVLLTPASLAERIGTGPAATPSPTQPAILPPEPSASTTGAETVRRERPAARPRSNARNSGMDDLLDSRSASPRAKPSDGMPESILPPDYPVSTTSH